MANRLSLNVAKIEFMLISTRQTLRLLGSKQVKIQIEGENISQDEKAKSLCVLINDNLT